MTVPFSSSMSPICYFLSLSLSLYSLHISHNEHYFTIRYNIHPSYSYFLLEETNLNFLYILRRKQNCFVMRPKEYQREEESIKVKVIRRKMVIHLHSHPFSWTGHRIQFSFIHSFLPIIFSLSSSFSSPSFFPLSRSPPLTLFLNSFLFLAYSSYLHPRMSPPPMTPTSLLFLTVLFNHKRRKERDKGKRKKERVRERKGERKEREREKKGREKRKGEFFIKSYSMVTRTWVLTWYLSIINSPSFCHSLFFLFLVTFTFIERPPSSFGFFSSSWIQV